MPEIVIQIEKCKACGLCIYYCPQKCLALSASLNKKGYAYAQAVKKEACIGCGICYQVCPDVCITVRK